jgi:hypothetical protein
MEEVIARILLQALLVFAELALVRLVQWVCTSYLSPATV